MALDLNTSCRYIRGVGPARAALLDRAGIHTVEDLLGHLPFRYEDRSRFTQIAGLVPGERVTIQARIRKPRLIHTRRRGFVIMEALLEDASGEVPALWYNQAYLRNVLREGRLGAFYGEPRIGRRGARKLVLENPRYEILPEEDSEGIHTGRVVPIYPRIDTLSSRLLRQILHQVIADLPTRIADPLPSAIVKRHGLLDRREAFCRVHFPVDTYLEPYQEGASPAHRRIFFEEMFLLQLGLALRKQERRAEKRGRVYRTSPALRRKLQAVLPYRLTAAQRKVFREIIADLLEPSPMNRLLQGDVGAGKTIVALLAMLTVVESGFQTALMAPTGILAEQHFLTLRQYLRGTGYRVELLTSAVQGRKRTAVLERIASGWVQLLIGTHSLIQGDVQFAKLALVVIDEQHRFGVGQRQRFGSKGRRPDILVMTATPIPRSLALTVYGDLDLSVIDELPPGRQPVRTFIRDESSRPAIFRFIRSEARRGRQSFIVTPRLEETGRSNLRAARSLAGELADGPFRGQTVALLHGKMTPEEKDAVMQDFSSGNTSILVATTVVEVGIDVPGATVMMIENAERFGLSQLHQLRGRVGRGKERGVCILLAGAGLTPESRRRLEILERSRDGFAIAEADLQLRGPGELLGNRQSGVPELRWIRLLRNRQLLEEARQAAFDTVQENLRIDSVHRNLFRFVAERWEEKYGRIHVG